MYLTASVVGNLQNNFKPRGHFITIKFLVLERDLSPVDKHKNNMVT